MYIHNTFLLCKECYSIRNHKQVRQSLSIMSIGLWNSGRGKFVASRDVKLVRRMSGFGFESLAAYAGMAQRAEDISRLVWH